MENKIQVAWQPSNLKAEHSSLVRSFGKINNILRN